MTKFTAEKTLKIKSSDVPWFKNFQDVNKILSEEMEDNSEDEAMGLFTKLCFTDRS